MKSNAKFDFPNGNRESFLAQEKAIPSRAGYVVAYLVVCPQILPAR